MVLNFKLSRMMVKILILLMRLNFQNVTVPKFNYQLDRDYYLYIQEEGTIHLKRFIS